MSQFQSQNNNSDKKPSDYHPDREQITPMTVRMLQQATVNDNAIYVDQKPTQFVTLMVRVIGVVDGDKCELEISDDTGSLKVTLFRANQIKVPEFITNFSQDPQGSSNYCKIQLFMKVYKEKVQYTVKSIKEVDDGNQVYHHYASVIAEKLKRTKGGSMNQEVEVKQEIQKSNEYQPLETKILNYFKSRAGQQVTLNDVAGTFSGSHSIQNVKKELLMLKENGNIIEGDQPQSYKLV